MCNRCWKKTLEGADKAQVIHDFNEATFVERYPVFPGYEQAYLHPENGGNPLVIDTKGRKKRLLGYLCTFTTIMLM
ncbi:hypothetical protein GCM10020331_064950 [Ectobacillus funiculus]